MSLHKQAINYTVGRVLAALIGFCVLVYYSHAMQPELYSRYVESLVIVNVLNLFLFQWLRVTMTRFLSATHISDGINFSSFFTIYLVIILFILFIFFIFSFLIDPTFIFITAIMLVSCSLNDFFLEVLRSKFLSLRYSIQYVVRQLLIACISYLLISYDVSYPIHIAYILGNTLSLAVNINVWATDIRLTNCFKKMRQIIINGSPLSINYGISALMNNIDKLIVIQLVGKEIGGIYSLIIDLVRQAVMIVMEAVNLAAYPNVVREYTSKGAIAAISKMKLVLKLLLLSGGGTVLTFWIFAGFIGNEVLGSDYAAGALILMPIIALATLLRGMKVYYFDQAFQLTVNNSSLMINAIISLFAMIAIYFILTQYEGMEMAAYANLTTFFATMLLSLFSGRKFLKLSICPLFTILYSAFFILLFLGFTSFDIIQLNLLNQLLCFGLFIFVYGLASVTYLFFDMRTSHVKP
ncbi:oligosaccharide flippase family protein [Paraglaciecola sp.]|uniref:lipopolysaccharide biosynthesis protein n=1 Tax=Paraglaciecola sp. TaxID=1920173 RepID=UPI0030F49512